MVHRTNERAPAVRHVLVAWKGTGSVIRRVCCPEIEPGCGQVGPGRPALELVALGQSRDKENLFRAAP